MTDTENVESERLLNFYRNKFANQNPEAKQARSLKAMTVDHKRLERSSSVALSSSNLMAGYGREDLADQLHAAKMKLNKAVEEKKSVGT